MKKLFRFWIVATLLFVGGCNNEFDDTEIWNSIDSIEQRLSALETVMNAYENKLFINSVTEIENGYVITFSDGSKATIMNGKDGKDGKVSVDGADGNNGTNGDTYIASITIGENEVVFVLSDGDTFSIPLYNALSITFDTETVVVAESSTVDVCYEIESFLPAITVEVISSSDIKAKVEPDNESGLTGKIHITTGATIDEEYSKVVVFVSNGDKVIMRSLKFEEAGLEVDEDAAVKEATAEGGEVALEFLSNVECEVVIPEDAQSWISVVPATRAMEKHTITLKLESNEGAARSAEIEIKSIDGQLSLTYSVTQEANLDYQLALEREALIAIYNALDGDNWTNNENWCSDKPVGDWYGVITNDNGVVTGLHLMDNNLIGEIPECIGNLINLEELPISYNRLTGKIPDSLGNLIKLKWLALSDNNLSGTIDVITKLVNVESLYLGGNRFTGTIPNDIGNLTHLAMFGCGNNNLTGPIPDEICNLHNISRLTLENNRLTGHIPERLRELKNLNHLSMWGNQLSGEIPQSFYDWELWKSHWGLCIADNNFKFEDLTLPGPNATVNCFNGKTINLETEYSKNKYTILYGWGGPENADSKAILSQIKTIHKNYSEKGVEIIGWAHYDATSKEKAIEYITQEDIQWDNFYYHWAGNCTLDTTDSFGCASYPTGWHASITVVDASGKIIFSDVFDKNIYKNDSYFTLLLENDFKGIDLDDIYQSTDYSKDGEVKQLQKASKGGGIDIVLMGDAYSDRQIADGTYKTDMEYIYNNLFTEEPYKSFKDHFNVHYVNVVSKNEGYGAYNETALSGYFGDGTLVGGNDNVVFDYALKAISEEEMDEALLIVAMNSDNYAGTCWMYWPTVNSDCGSGVSVAYFPRGGDAETFAQLLHHEACGHGFAKLADEYAYEDMGAVSSDYVSEIKSQQSNWGWWKNVDFTSDPTATRWSHFINDTRYANDGLGAYEGGLTYWTGVWRPTENSIMRYNTGGFNAPSREAIYYRIHKLAYGDSWEYDYEDFVEWDARNRAADATRAMIYKPKNYQPTHPPVMVNKSWRDAK